MTTRTVKFGVHSIGDQSIENCGSCTKLFSQIITLFCHGYCYIKQQHRQYGKISSRWRINKRFFFYFCSPLFRANVANVAYFFLNGCQPFNCTSFIVSETDWFLATCTTCTARVCLCVSRISVRAWVHARPLKKSMYVRLCVVHLSSLAKMQHTIKIHNEFPNRSSICALLYCLNCLTHKTLN